MAFLSLLLLLWNFLMFIMLWAIYGHAFWAWRQRRKGTDNSATLHRLTIIAPAFLILSVPYVLVGNKFTWMADFDSGIFMLIADVAATFAMAFFLFSSIDWRALWGKLRCKGVGAGECIRLWLTAVCCLYLFFVSFVIVLTIAIICVCAVVIFWVMDKAGVFENKFGRIGSNSETRCCKNCTHYQCDCSQYMTMDVDSESCSDFSHR